MKTLIRLLATCTALTAQESPRTLTPAEAQAALSPTVQRTAPTVKDQGVDRAYTVPKETFREYERNFVIVKKSDGSTAKLPLLDLPVRFVKNKTTLVDATSQANLHTLAQTIAELATKENARFEIEGHASPEGDPQRNSALSQERADAIAQALALSLPEGTLRSRGFGSTHANSKPNSPEGELAQDRKIRVVRVR